MNNTLIISPSGNFYGSEQVLYDYLGSTSLHFDIAVPEKSVLENKLKNVFSNHTLRGFSNDHLVLFYTKLLTGLLFGRYQHVYINEAGHTRYILLLAKFFPKKKFFIHVRIIEDTAAARWKLLPGKNVTILSISNFIQNALPFNSELLYDPFHFTDHEEDSSRPASVEMLRVGIIGRVTRTKGLDKLFDLITYLRSIDAEKKFRFKLFGTIEADARNDNWIDKLASLDAVSVEGFYDNQNEMYRSIDCILHLSEQEALGRIFLEAINIGKPFIGMDAAGIGEIGHLLNMEDALVQPGKNAFIEIAGNLKLIANQYAECCKAIDSVKTKAAEIFGMPAYKNTMDKLLAG